MRRPNHRIAGWKPFDGLECGRRTDNNCFLSLVSRFRGWSTKKCYYLFAVFIVGCLLLHLSHTALQMNFRVDFLPTTSPTGGPFGSTYTIRVNTFRRNDMLKRFLGHFARCPNVQAIQVIWSDQGYDPPSLMDWAIPLSTQDLSKVTFEVQPTDSLNNRFRALLPVPTPAVLSLDDDLVIPCETLDFAYSIWQAAPQSLVGFTPRLVTWDGETASGVVAGKKVTELEAGEGAGPGPGAAGSYRYLSSFKHVWWHGRYNMILTKCCFLHRDFLSLYFSSLTPEVLQYIDDRRNCEDIAMQFVVANHTRGAPPVWVQARFTDYGQKSGISQGEDHARERGACVGRLVKEFGSLCLTTTSHKAIDARRSWIW